MTKWELFSRLSGASIPREYIDSNGKMYDGILQSVQREDGSGHSFNVQLNTLAGVRTIHVRTTD